MSVGESNTGGNREPMKHLSLGLVFVPRVVEPSKIKTPSYTSILSVTSLHESGEGMSPICCLDSSIGEYTNHINQRYSMIRHLDPGSGSF